jgi:very-short-patch-repair endonuclease
VDELRTLRGGSMTWSLCGSFGAAISHVSGLGLLGLRPHPPGDIHVSVPRGGGRSDRFGIQMHRRLRFEWVRVGPFRVTSPTQCLVDAGLKPHELYRALEEAEARGYPLTLPLSDVVRLKRAVEGRTRSDTEARFILLCHEERLPLPLVNHILNGYEADFHWPDRRIVVEVDGFEHHRERRQFNEDRLRGLVHRRAGYEVVRVSADHVYDQPELVVGAMRDVL